MKNPPRFPVEGLSAGLHPSAGITRIRFSGSRAQRPSSQPGASELPVSVFVFYWQYSAPG
jgi:hypothetical protein